jgi:4-carboxymuconolactone decarboxylase
MKSFGLLWLAAVLSVLGVPALAQNRMPEIPSDKLTDAQKKALDQFISKRGGPLVRGPFLALLRSPDVMTPAEILGEYLQFKTVLPPKLREFVILITARQWTQDTEWNSHVAIAIKDGLSPEIAKDLAAGQRPAGMAGEEAAVYDFCDELHRNQSVSDATYAKALDKFGEQGVVDIISVNGYYTWFAMIMNSVRAAPYPPIEGMPTMATFPRKGS